MWRPPGGHERRRHLRRLRACSPVCVGADTTHERSGAPNGAGRINQHTHSMAIFHHYIFPAAEVAPSASAVVLSSAASAATTSTLAAAAAAAAAAVAALSPSYLPPQRHILPSPARSSSAIRILNRP